MAALPNLRRLIGNRFSTTLSASVTDSALSMTVSDATGADTAGGYIMIDEADASKREIVYAESISGNTVTISTAGRGLAGTTAVAHDSGATFTDIIADENINGLIDMFKVGHSDAGAHVLPNNTALSIKESGGTARDIVKVTSGDVLEIGYNTLPIIIKGKNDGWNSIGDTWAYASATTITVPAGAATYYAVGDKIKLTQTTVKYFYVVGVADTVLTVTGGTDYTVADAAITAIYHSRVESPIGFPGRFEFTPAEVGWSSMTTQKGWFSIHGRTVFCPIYMSGTSDSTTATAGLPVTAATVTGSHSWGGANSYAANAGTEITAASAWRVLSGGTTVAFYTNMNNAAWTNSAEKTIAANLTYGI